MGVCYHTPDHLITVRHEQCHLIKTWQQYESTRGKERDWRIGKHLEITS